MVPCRKTVAIGDQPASSRELAPHIDCHRIPRRKRDEVIAPVGIKYIALEVASRA
jgi:hypothetical protein